LARHNIICGLDIGTSNIRLAVAQINPGQEKPQIIGVGQALSFGVRKGIVVDIEETVRGIKQAIEEAERSMDFGVENIFVNIGGNHISCRLSKGVVAVSRADGEISEEDTERAIKAAQAVSIPQNREIIHAIPRSFSVDSEKYIKDPVGMTGVRLESDVILIEGSTPFIKNLHKCLHEGEIEPSGMVLSTLASSKAVLSKRQKELGVLVLDFGGGTTGMTVYEEGDVIYTCVLPIGGSHITNDIAIGLRTSVDIAERVKLEYGTLHVGEIGKKETVDLTKFGKDEEGIFPRKFIAEIIQARFFEIFDLVNRELKRIDRQGLLPAGIVMVGGGAKMPGLVDLAKSELRLPAQISFPANIDGIMNRIDDPSFATAVGLVLWGMREDSATWDARPAFPLGKGFFDSIKRIFKNFMP
jgi:cell division protein FtsA